MATIMVLILINAIIVGIETYPHMYDAYGQWLHVADRVLLWLFTLEIILRLITAIPTWHYFKDPWNIFDFLIVASGHLFVGAHFVTVLRILRVLRLLRAISIIPSLRRIVNALLMTIPALGNIMLLLSLLFYIFAVIGTMLFGDIAPDHFGSLHATLLTLFQVVTLESWASGVMRPLLDQSPFAWMYFVSFILVGTFVIFNLFVGVIVSNVEKVDELEEEKEKAARKAVEINKQSPGDLTEQKQEMREKGQNEEASLNVEINALREELREIKALLREQQRGSK
nr:ion transporter [Caldalkalibacillus salinus]